jgi:signal transduction histidine kinase
VKTPRKAIAALAVATLLGALWVPPAFSALARVKAAAQSRREAFTVLILANQLLSEVKDAETGQRGYLLTGDESFLAPWLSSRDTVSEHLSQLRSAAHTSVAVERLDAMRPLLDAKLAELSATIEMRRHGDVEAVVARVRAADGKRSMDAMRVEMIGIIEAETERIAQQEVALGASLRRLMLLMALGSLTTLLSALGFAYWIRRDGRHRIQLRRLEVENVALVAASRHKSEFLSTMSHELRTPLNAIIGFSEVLNDGLVGPLADQQREFVGIVLGSGKHLLSLINDILDLAKVEAGQMTLDLEPVELSSLLANSVSILKEKAAKGRVRLVVDAPDDLGVIQADARKLKQILYNLLSNAVKFTPDGGRVTLRAGRVSRAEVGRLSGAWAGRSLPLADSEFAEFVRFGITDDGIGISTDGLARLFKPFSQIDSRLARAFDGTGLGLALVKTFVELHGGTVAVESAEEEGSRFVVWLPLRAPGAPDPVPAGDPAGLSADASAPATDSVVAGSGLA